MQRRRFWWVPYVYLLRIQILTGAIVIGLPLVALVPQPSALLNGLFDVDYGNGWKSAAAMAAVASAAIATTLTLLATAWVIAVNSPDRFETEPIQSIAFPIGWSHRLVFCAAALPVMVGVVMHSWSASGVSRVTVTTGAIAGALGTLFLLTKAFNFAITFERAIARQNAGGLARYIKEFALWLAAKPNIREGYVDETGALRPGHLTALFSFAVSFLIYAAIGVNKFFRVGYPPVVPTLAALLLLILVVCWAASGLAFFFDRYRVPVMLPLFALPLLTAVMPLSDHFYQTQQVSPGYSAPPDEVLVHSDSPVIVVATTGGGIQAAAWTARVLTGLEQAARGEFGDLFGRSIRMISSVSGGGVGAMYFVNQYEDGRLPLDLQPVLKQAEASSLDDVAWGVAYPDLLHVFLPVFRIDRGQALEWAWTRAGGVAAVLGRWRQDVWEARRPAIIFNGTLVDTGERLLIGSTRIGWQSDLGMRNFEDLYPGADIKIVTAARLSASSPYVSPAARPDLPGRQYHVVDGAYYDNYGMTTLIEWLSEALEETADRQWPKRVLVLQIRASQSAEDIKPDGWHGWPYQTWAPVKTMLTVRTTGQLSHNEQEFARLQQLWARRDVQIDNAVFQFCGSRPPFSWHLTGREKEQIEQEWQREISAGWAWRTVRAFLAGSPLPADVVERGCQ
jgi:Patatin-like phospholipase